MELGYKCHVSSYFCSQKEAVRSRGHDVSRSNTCLRLVDALDRQGESHRDTRIDAQKGVDFPRPGSARQALKVSSHSIPVNGDGCDRPTLPKAPKVPKRAVFVLLSALYVQ